MFYPEELNSINRRKYDVLISNGHDCRMRSRLTGHEWVVISDYNGMSCMILHRNSGRDGFHRQRGTYPSLEAALDYIMRHDAYVHSRKQL